MVRSSLVATREIEKCRALAHRAAPVLAARPTAPRRRGLDRATDSSISIGDDQRRRTAPRFRRADGQKLFAAQGVDEIAEGTPPSVRSASLAAHLGEHADAVDHGGRVFA